MRINEMITKEKNALIYFSNSLNYCYFFKETYRDQVEELVC